MREAAETGEVSTVEQYDGKRLPIADMQDILRLITRVESLDVLLEKIAATIARAFRIRSLAIVVLDEKTGMFCPKAVYGFPVERTASIGRHCYTLERKRQDLRDECKIGPNCYYVRAEDQKVTYSDDVDYILELDEIDRPRRSPSDWHPLDYIDVVMTDRLGNWIGWVEIAQPEDGRVPSKDVLDRIHILADLASIAVENSNTYEEAIGAVKDAQGYLDLIVHDVSNLAEPLLYYTNSISLDAIGDAELREKLEKTRAIGTSVKRLVDDVRKLSEVKYSAPVPDQRYKLREVLERCISETKRDVHSKRVVVELDFPYHEAEIVADELVYDLFKNLLTNAAKFCPHAVAKVDVKVVDGYSTWSVRVEDYGIGIPDSRKKAVFSRFAKRSEGLGGAGLGLSIVALLVARYGGIVSVSDRVKGDYSKGAAFEVTLPKARSEHS